MKIVIDDKKLEELLFAAYVKTLAITKIIQSL